MTERTEAYQQKIKMFMKKELGFNANDIDFPSDQDAFRFADRVRDAVVQAKESSPGSQEHSGGQRSSYFIFSNSGGAGLVVDRHKGTVVAIARRRADGGTELLEGSDTVSVAKLKAMRPYGDKGFPNWILEQAGLEDKK